MKSARCGAGHEAGPRQLGASAGGRGENLEAEGVQEQGLHGGSRAPCNGGGVVVIGAGVAQQGQSLSLESCLLLWQSPRNPYICSTVPCLLGGPTTLQSYQKPDQPCDLYQHREQQSKAKPHTWLSSGSLALQRALLPPCTQPPTSPQLLTPSFLTSTPKSPRCLIHAWISLQFQPLECGSQLGSQAAGCMAAASLPSQGSSGVKLR